MFIKEHYSAIIQVERYTRSLILLHLHPEILSFLVALNPLNYQHRTTINMLYQMLIKRAIVTSQRHTAQF